MTNEELETLQKFIGSEDQGLIDLATEMIHQGDLTLEEYISLHQYARNREHSDYEFFKTTMNMYGVSKGELTIKEERYYALCILIGAIQEKIKAHEQA